MKNSFLQNLIFAGLLAFPLGVLGQVKGSSAVPCILEEILVVPGDSIANRWQAHALSMWKNRPANKENLETIISELLHCYSDNGFPFAEITPRVEEAGAGQARLQLSIITGPAVYVSKLQCRAFSSGEQKQLARMLAFYPGFFDEREIEGWKSRVRQFPDLVWQGEPKLAGAPDFTSAGMELPVFRRAKNRVEGGLGYAPGGLEGGAFGELSIQLVTLGKIGREAAFNWKRPNGQTRSLSVGYQDFFLAPAAFYVFGRLGQEEKDEQFFRFGARGGVSALVADGWKGGLNFGYDRIMPRQTSFPAPTDSAAARQYELGLQVQKGEEKLTDEGYVLLKFGMEYKKVFTGGRLKSGTPKQLRLEAAGNFRPGSRWSVFAKAEAEAKWVSSFLFTRSDLHYLGGFGTLRGYLDESLPAIRYFSGQAEPRFYLGNQDYLFGFFDFALLAIGENQSGLSVSDGFKPGTGLGVSAGGDKLVLAVGWGEKAKIKDGILYLRLSGEL